MKLALSLRARIAMFFVALLVAVQLVAFGFVNQTNYATAQSKIEDELNVGQRVFERVLAQNADKLKQSASILAADFAFREAIATQDLETVKSALENHGARIHAAAMMFVSSDGRLVAASGDADVAAHAGELGARLRDVRADGSAQVQLFQGKPFQRVVVPVRAPVTIGWIVLWFAIDEDLAQDLRQLTQLDVSFVAMEDDRCRVLASTLPMSARRHLEQSLSKLPEPGHTLRLDVPEGTQQTRVLTLSTEGGRSLAAVIERPLASALENYRALQTTLIMIGIASLVLSAAGSLLIARGITAPIHRLLGSAQRMRQGDYDAPIDASGEDEIGALAAGLDHMRLGIHDRERRILKLAYEDPLTGLPNRLQFGNMLEAAILNAEKTGVRLTILLMDLNRFKFINDALGHDVGDHVLAKVAERLQLGVRVGDPLARMGGDEFAVLLEAVEIEGAIDVARRIVAVLEAPIDYEGQPVDVSVSIGIAQFPEHGVTDQALTRNADIAMYVAKRGRRDHAVFEPGSDDSQQQHLSLIGELRHAVENDEFDLYYQPKLSITSAAIYAVEALVRWHHPQRGFVPPNQFIPFAESTGYIREISRWVLERAILQAGRWRRQGIAIQISVNLSTKDLLNRDLPETLSATLARHGVPAEAICLEITESGFMEDPDHVLKVLNRLSSLGFSLSIDDFGTGYSSLTYLMRLPVDELKIDRSFISNVATDKDLETIVRSTVELGHNLGLKVVAEGVEDQESLDLLAVLGCDSVQGYLLSPPLPLAKFESWYESWHQTHSSSAATDEKAPHTALPARELTHRIRRA